jgi:hypothetical protein
MSNAKSGRTSSGRPGRPRRAAPVTLATSATPDCFARQHGTFAEVDMPAVIDQAPASGKVWRNLTQTPLDRLLHRGSLTPRQWAAGERLRGDLHAAALGPRVTTRLDAAIGSARTDPAWGLAPGERAAAARRRVRQTLDAVGAPLAAVLIAVVWHDSAPGHWATTTGLDASSARPAGMMALRLALDTLADRYGLKNEGGNASANFSA